MEVNRLSQVATRQMSASAREQFERGLLKFEKGSINRAMSIRGQRIKHLQEELASNSSMHNEIGLKSRIEQLEATQKANRSELRDVNESLGARVSANA